MKYQIMETLNLGFMRGKEFRKIIKNDFEEVKIASKHKAWKAVIILCGSIIEVILSEILIQHGIEPNKVYRMTFSALLEKAIESSYISKEELDLSSVIKNYRNLIHPGRNIRLLFIYVLFLSNSSSWMN